MATLAMSLAWPLTLHSQARGTVFDETGHPLSGVAVELWSSSGRVASLVTDPQGSFNVSAGQLEQTTRFALRRIGFRMLAVLNPRSLVFTMQQLPVPLPELSVVVGRRACPAPDRPEARALWSKVAERYSNQTLLRGLTWNGLTVRGEVEPEAVGVVDESRLSAVWVRFAGAAWPPAAGRYRLADSIIDRSGYAERLDTRTIGVESDYFAWRYPELDARHAAHFASPVFGSRHSFQVLDRTAAGVVLAFCKTRGDAPGVEGTLTIGSDSTFVYAAWTFHTPKPDEQAGGEVVFAPPVAASDGRPHLLAARGTFWRRLGGRRLYFQRATVYLRWVVSPDGSMPPQIP